MPQQVLAKRGRGGHALDGLGRHGCGGQVEREAEREVEIHRGRRFLEAEQRGVVGARGGLGGGVGAEPYPLPAASPGRAEKPQLAAPDSRNGR